MRKLWKKQWFLKEKEIHKSGYLKGYANFYIDVNGYEYEGLFRILDRENGKDLNIVNIDNGSEEQEYFKNNWNKITYNLIDATLEDYIRSVNNLDDHPGSSIANEATSPVEANSALEAQDSDKEKTSTLRRILNNVQNELNEVGCTGEIMPNREYYIFISVETEPDRGKYYLIEPNKCDIGENGTIDTEPIGKNITVDYNDLSGIVNACLSVMNQFDELEKNKALNIDDKITAAKAKTDKNIKKIKTKPITMDSNINKNKE